MRNNSVQQFESGLFGSLVVLKDNNGALWFWGKQVAEKLGFGGVRNNISMTLTRHCLDQQNYNETFNETVNVLPQGMRRNSVVISEGDLYRLVMGSTLPSAVAFQNWVCEEVLPSIREHGGYNAEQPSMAEQRADEELFRAVHLLHDTVTGVVAELREELSQSRAERAEYMATIRELAQVRTAPEETPLRPLPEDCMTFGDMYECIGGVISTSAFKSLLRNARWPTETYEKRLEDGRVVELTAYKRIAHVAGITQDVHFNQLVTRVVEDCINGFGGGRQISAFYYEHPLITSRFRIN